MKFRDWLESARKAAPLVLLRVGLVLVLLELAYLLVANVLLMSPLLKRVVNPAEDVELDYDWAYSPFPGRICIKNLALRIEDYNVQFFVGIERATIDVRLEKLVSRRFHAVRLNAEGTTFRMRHKFHDVGKDAMRVAAYPPIAGFADPPLYRGPHPPPIPDSEYALWDVRIENVMTSLREVWILEYRYRGEGRAFGSFHVLPARWYEVEHAGLELSRGRLSVGDTAVAERMNLRVDCRVLGTDPRSGTGLEPLRTVSAGVHGKLEGANLAFLDVYAVPFLGISTTGGADVELNVDVDRGVVREGSRVLATTRAFVAQNSRFRVLGAPVLELGVPPAPASPHLVVGMKADRITFAGPAPSSVSRPYVEGAEVRASLTRNLSQPLSLLATHVGVPKAVVPELGWFEPLFSDEATKRPRLRGQGTASFVLDRDAARRLSGSLEAKVRATRVQAEALGLSGHFGLDAAFSSAPETPGAVAFSKLEFSAESATFSTDDRNTPPWTATVRSDDTHASLEPLRADGSLTLRAARTEPLLPLLIESGALRDVLSAGLGLKDLRARALFAVEPRGVRLEVRDARSGAVTARGFLETAPRSEPDGRFLISTAIANVGVRIDDGETSVKPLVSDAWLSKGTFVLPRAKQP